MNLILQHYWQLLRRHHRLLAGIIVAATLIAGILAAIELATKPIYSASTHVIMLPTEPELAFTRGRVSTDRSAQLLTATRIEYLQSRGAAIALLERLGDVRDKLGPTEEEDSGLLGRIGGVASAIKSFFNRTYRILNSGVYVEPAPDDKVISAIQAAIKIRSVPGSYILEIQASLPSAEGAAFVANTLADVYLERVGEDLAGTAGEIEGFLSAEIATAEARLQSVIRQEMETRTALGLETLTEDLQLTSQLLEDEQRKLAESEVRATEIETQIASLREQTTGAPRGSVLERVSQDLSVLVPELEGLRSGLPQRRAAVRGLEARLTELRAREQPLTDILATRAARERDLEDLRNRTMTVRLSRSAALSKLRIIDPALPPTYPSSPQVLDDTLVGTFVGVLLALFLLVAIDTLSSSVSTTVDLQRVAGGRALGSLTARVIAHPRGRWVGKRARAAVRAAGSELERRLGMQGCLDADTTLVTGFLEISELAEATAALGLTLAADGREVFCRLPAGEDYHSTSLDTLTDGRLRFLGSQEEVAAGDRVLLQCLDPVSHRFSFRKAARESIALVCLIPAGRVSELEVEDFQERALAAGLTALGFVLVEI